MRIYGIVVGLAACCVVGFFVFIFVDALHNVEGASWIAVLIGIVVTIVLGWAIIKISEAI